MWPFSITIGSRKPSSEDILFLPNRDMYRQGPANTSARDLYAIKQRYVTKIIPVDVWGEYATYICIYPSLLKSQVCIVFPSTLKPCPQNGHH